MPRSHCCWETRFGNRVFPQPAQPEPGYRAEQNGRGVAGRIGGSDCTEKLHFGGHSELPAGEEWCAAEPDGVRRLQPGEQFQERRLATAIASDQSDALPLVNRERGGIENRALAVADGDIGGVEDGGHLVETSNSNIQAPEKLQTPSTLAHLEIGG